MKGMQTSHRLARSGFARAVVAPPAANTRLLVLCDSIGSLETAPRLAGGIVKRWGPTNWAGWTTQGPNNTNSEAFVVFKSYAGTDMTFNQRSPNTGVGGGSYTPTTYFAGNCPCNVLELVCGATPPANDTEMFYVQPQAPASAPWRNGPWWRNQAIRARLIYVVKNNDNWSIKVNGTRDGSAVVETLTDAADSGAGGFEVRTLDVSCGTPGPGETPRLSVRIVSDALNPGRTVGILGVRFYAASARHGLEVTLLGSSGWGWLDHSSTSNCSDALMQAYLDAVGRPNAVLALIGANLKNSAGNQETGGGNLEAGNYTNFKANAEAAINRYRTLLGNLSAALATCPVCLGTNYKTDLRSDTEMRGQCAALYELSESLANASFVNGYLALTGQVIKFDVTGPPHVHPSLSGAEAWAAGLWQKWKAAERGETVQYSSGGGGGGGGSTGFFPGGGS